MLKKFLDMTGAVVPNGIVHVGAHTGQEIVEYKEYAPRNLVWIEADPEVFQRLHKNVTQPWGLTNTEQWCLNALVSDTDGEMVDFHLAKNGSQSSSMFDFTDLLISRFPHAAPTGTVLQLESKTLNSLLTGVGLEPSQIDYLVLDTQGAELKCLAGLGSFIDHLQYLTVEVSTVEYYSGGAQMHELDTHLESRSFLRISGTPNWQHGDALYIRVLSLPAGTDPILSSDDVKKDESMRQYVNNVIARMNDKETHGDCDFAALDDELFAAYEEYESVFARSSSHAACLTMARVAYDEGMGKSLTAFLKPLHCV